MYRDTNSNMADKWGIQEIWNHSLEIYSEREAKPRDYLWASELAKLETDVYLALKGEKPTNPPNARSHRKFEAGELWEWLVKILLERAGILKSSQARVKFQYEGLLEVSGKIDFIAGGTVVQNVDLDSLGLPERTLERMKTILEYLRTNYSNELELKALEVKSVSSHMMNALEIGKRPLLTHAMQAYHYTKHEDVNETLLVYICRDDVRMMEFNIVGGDLYYEDLYRGHIEKMTEIYKAGKMPEKASPVVFDDLLGKFTLDRRIGWSPYLTKVYGLEDQVEFDDKYKKIPESWNRVLTRMVNGQSMTKNNEAKIEEMKEWGFDPEPLVEKIKKDNEQET